MSWGIFPDDAVARLRRREWDNTANLRKRLLGERAFPIELALAPPPGTLALADLDRFRAWLAAWKAWPAQDRLRYEVRNLRHVGQHRIPITLVLPTMEALIESLGPVCIARSQGWERCMRPLLELDEGLYPTLVAHLARLESLTSEEANALATVLPQLVAGMGRGGFLRSLALRGVDTKFVETHYTLLSAFLDVLHDGALTRAGDLYQWLDCRRPPSGWFHVRPLCPRTTEALAGLSLLRLAAHELHTTALPGQRVLVVENVQSGLALPPLPDTVAIFGGGQNITWAGAAWLDERHVGYWGDLDTWGLKFLSDARGQHRHIEALMMDVATLERFAERQVVDPRPFEGELPGLANAQMELLAKLRAQREAPPRLEQERLDAHYVHDHLARWASA